MTRANTQPAEKVALNPDAVTRVGRIVAVTGAHAIILLDAEDRTLDAETERSPEIGTLLKVDCTTSISLALVSALSSPMPSHNKGEQELRIVEVEFIGELPKDENGKPKSFRRGISSYPSLGDTVFRANRTELAKAYAVDTETSIRVGHIQQDPTIPAMIKIDEMLGKHFAVLGTTGTGKSCTVALILRRILEKNPQAHILLLDVHREYSQSFQGISEVITPDNMVLPFWLLNFDESVEILIGQQASREGDVEILREIIPMAKGRYLSNQRRDKSGVTRTTSVLEGANIGVDTPLPYRTSDLINILEEYIGKLELRGELAPYKRLKARIETITRDPRYAFMFGSLTVQDNMTAVLARLFRIPVNGKPIAILELGGLPSEIINVVVSVLARLFRIPVNGKPIAILELGGLPSEIINVVVSVLARLAFDFGVWSAGRIPITFVCEEAHRYVPNDKTLGFEPTKRAISKIAKEGRKYGVSLCMVTQRPAELDPTILSQCNTIFSMRLTNERDQDILRAGISDAAASLLEFMSTMGTGEAIVFGEGVALPTRIKFDMLPEDAAPKSNTASFTTNWSKDLPDDSFLHEIVGRWRAQTFNPDSSTYTTETAPAPVAPPSPQPMRRDYATPPPIQQRPGIQPAPSAFGQVPPAASSRAQPAAAQPVAAATAQPSLASLIKQFRT